MSNTTPTPTLSGVDGDNGTFATTTSLNKTIPDSLQECEEGNGEAAPISTSTSTIDPSTGKAADNLSHSTTTSNSVDDRKMRPKRAMILSGIPAPALPPRPVFPSDLENYQAQGHGNGLNPQYNALVQAYISRLRQDYEKQLVEYEDLKNSVKEDTFFSKTVVDELDALDEDPFTLDSFENLMRLHASKNKDFILARVTTQDPNDENKLYHSYYGAHQINKVLFRTQPDEGLLHRMKARNPLNNMLVVGDVHYYIISAEELNAIKPLPAPRSSSSSVSSHSSRMSRCSKLAAQAIASQSASARSSPILGCDVSLFSQTSDVESLESIIPASMAMSILKADQEDGCSISENCEEAQPDTPCQDNASSRARRGSVGSYSSSTSSRVSTPFVPQNGFQPCKPSRLRQATAPLGQESSSNQQCSNQPEMDNPQYSPMSPRDHNSHSSHNHPRHQSVQSPLFQSLMGGRIRSRSSTVSSIRSDRSATSLTFSSTMSTAGDDDQSSVTKYRSNASDIDGDNTSVSSSIPSSPSPLSSSESSHVESVRYNFQYLASDDDFLLRSSIRQVFKVNALESWDAILFTISNNALREYSNQGGEQGLQQLHQHQQQQQQQQQQEEEDGNDDEGEELELLVDAEDSESDTPLTRSNGRRRPRSQETTSMPPPNDPRNPTIESGHGDANSFQHGSSSEMSRSIPTLPAPFSATSSAHIPTLPSTSSSLPGSSPISSSSTSPPGAHSAGVTRLTMHDSGHSSTSSLPSVQSYGAGAGTSVGIPHRLASSAVFPSSPVSTTGDEKKGSGGKKLRRAISKIFSIS
ncbi:hypothetical protein BGX27_010787 [Mortierella sp. AM989]|nr:hypothetical protein BGX27_010787 [Mortierella sp. AM989]